MTDIEFKVGQEYENMKGAYRVLTVKKDAMSICWESGEEVTTTMALQCRITERMDHIRRLIRAKRGEKSKKARTSEYASEFEGLKKADFSGDVAGASWRHHDGLGGAVAVRLPSERFNIASWPRYGLPEIQWADISHRCASDFRLQAKLFARLNKDSLCFGFYVERSDEENDTKDDWNAFIAWLREEENDAWLKNVVAEHGLSIYDAKAEGAFAGSITSADGKWSLLGEGQEQEVERLADFLDGLTESSRVDLQIAKMVKKNRAVTHGFDIADEIADLFQVLMPLYEASAVFG